MKATAAQESVGGGTRPIAPRKPESAQVIHLHELLVEGRGLPQQPAYLVAPNGQRQEIPEAIYRVLLAAAEAMAQGDAVSIVSVHQELTTQQAADLLNVSRPHLVKMLENGDVPHHKTGSHRRIYFEDLRRYRDLRDAQRRHADLCVHERSEGTAFGPRRAVPHGHRRTSRRGGSDGRRLDRGRSLGVTPRRRLITPRHPRHPPP